MTNGRTEEGDGAGHSRAPVTGGQGKPRLAGGVIRRDVTLMPWHDGMISRRMTQQGISRSEALRQCIRDAELRSRDLAAAEVRSRVNLIRLQVGMLRIKPSHLLQAAREIEESLEAIVRLVSDGAVA